ncbi:hypothetical protein [Lentibacillus sp. Marseille-P4043]|uniref:hypothetical protein n=1 Tax=Lentibacillus sp. Marseille-P4043 TaxID=2040293 RepID=UPI00131A5E60|nr:hypothetical protein [Lentibacillus sp. Marseille-P4043]
MDTSKKIIVGIAIFVYTLAIIGLTTFIVHPNPNEQDVAPTQQDCDCADDSGSASE